MTEQKGVFHQTLTVTVLNYAVDNDTVLCYTHRNELIVLSPPSSGIKEEKTTRDEVGKLAADSARR